MLPSVRKPEQADEITLKMERDVRGLGQRINTGLVQIEGAFQGAGDVVSEPLEQIVEEVPAQLDVLLDKISKGARLEDVTEMREKLPELIKRSPNLTPYNNLLKVSLDIREAQLKEQSEDQTETATP